MFGKVCFRKLQEPIRTIWFNFCDILTDLIYPAEGVTMKELEDTERRLWETMFKIEEHFPPSAMTLLFHKLGHIVEEVVEWCFILDPILTF